MKKIICILLLSTFIVSCCRSDYGSRFATGYRYTPKHLRCVVGK